MSFLSVLGFVNIKGVVLMHMNGRFFQILITMMAAIGTLSSPKKEGRLSLKDISEVITAVVESEKAEKNQRKGDEDVEEAREVLVVI